MMGKTDVAGQYMIGQDVEGNPQIVRVDEEGRFLLSSTGTETEPINVEGNNSAVDTLFNSTDFIKVLGIMYAWDGTQYKRLNISSSGGLQIDDGTKLDEVTNLAAGGRGIIGWISRIVSLVQSGIIPNISALVNRSRTGLASTASGSIAIAGTSQQAVAPSTTRSYLLIQNISSADLWINFGNVAAIDTAGSLKLSSGEKIMFDCVVPTSSVNIIGGTIGQKYTIFAG